MAAKRKSKKKNNVLPTRETMSRIWKAVPPREWLQLLQEISPEQNWEMASAVAITGRCPYHDEDTPSFMLSPNRSMGKCFGCGKAVVDPISLISKLKRCSTKEALLFLDSKFNLEKLVPELTMTDIHSQHGHQEFKKDCAKAFNSLLNEVVREWDTTTHLDYLKPLVMYLKARGINFSSFTTIPIGAYGKPEHVKKYLSGDEHKGMYDEYFNRKDEEFLWGSLVFHFNDSPSTISRFKIRRINHNIDYSALGDLRKVPEEQARKFITKKGMTYIEDPYDKTIGVFGLHKYQQLIGAKDADAYITEGEFDALSVMSAQDAKGSPDFMIYATGGTASTGHLGFLREYGIKNIWLIPDHPGKNGNEWAKSVLSGKENFTRTVEYRPLNIKIFQWPVEVQGYDLDEAVDKNGYEVMYSILSVNRKAYFKNSMPWVQDLCDAKLQEYTVKFKDSLDKLDVNGESYQLEKANLLDEKERVILEEIMHWFSFIYDQGDQIAFTQKYTSEYGIDIAKIKEVRDSIHATNTMQGVVELVGDAFEECFEFAYYDAKSANVIMYLWHKQRKEMIPIKMSEASVFSLVSNYLGSSLTDWTTRLLGENPVLLDGTEDTTAMGFYNKKRSNAKTIVMEAIEQRQGKAKSIDNIIPVSQGIHMADISRTAKQKNFIYFVNGENIMKGQFTDTDGLVWEHFDRITDEGMRFTNINKIHQWSDVSDTSDLERAPAVDHRKVYNTIVDMLNGWKFENHEVMTNYLAAYIMSIPVMNAIGDVNITLITGSAESGKTSLTHGLLGGIHTIHQCPTILESVRYYVDATPASIYQGMDRSTLCFILDEAESGKENRTGKDNRNKEIMRMLYAIPQGGMKVNRGGATREHQESYFLRMPVIMAAISVPTDPTFLSRTLIVYTNKDQGRIDPGVYITEKYSNDEITALRRNITIGLLPHIPKLKKRAKELANHLSKKIPTISNRFVSSVIIPLTVYEFIGGDPEWMYEEIYNKYKHRLEAIHSNTANSSLINACLYTEGVRIISGDGVHQQVPPKQLILNGDFTVLNNSDCGVYFSIDKNVIILVWRQIRHTILRHTFYASSGESVLREQASKVPEVLGDVDYTYHTSLMKELGITDVRKQTDYTVLDVSYLIGLENSIPGTHSMQELDKKLEEKMNKAREKAEKELLEAAKAAKKERKKKKKDKIKGMIKTGIRNVSKEVANIQEMPEEEKEITIGGIDDDIPDLIF